MPEWFTRRGSVIEPCDEDAKAALMRCQEGKPFQMHIDRSRSPSWHRLYMKRCAVIGEMLGLSKDAVDAKSRMMAGHVELAGEWEGKPLYVPARIAFDKLSADGWQAIWLGLEKAHEELLPGISQEVAGHSTW